MCSTECCCNSGRDTTFGASTSSKPTPVCRLSLSCGRGSSKAAAPHPRGCHRQMKVRPICGTGASRICTKGQTSMAHSTTCRWTPSCGQAMPPATSLSPHHQRRSRSTRQDPRWLSSVPVGRRSSRAPHPNCGEGLQPAPSRRSDVRAVASNAALAVVAATRLRVQPLAVRKTRPFAQNTCKPTVTHLFEPGCGGCCVLLCVVVFLEWLYYSKRIIIVRWADLSDFFSLIFVGKMCIFVSRPMKIVTFLRKNDYPPKRVVDFPRERDTFRNKIMEIVKDFGCEFHCFSFFFLFSSFFSIFPFFFIFSFFSFFHEKFFFHFLLFSHFFHLFLFCIFFILSFKIFFFIFFIFPFFHFFNFCIFFHFLIFSPFFRIFSISSFFQFFNFFHFFVFSPFFHFSHFFMYFIFSFFIFHL